MSAESKMVQKDARLPTDRSPPAVASNPTVQKSPKLTTPPAKKIVIPSVLQADLKLAKEDLKKANKKLASMEKENLSALKKLKKSKMEHKSTKEAYEKLKESLATQSEENSKIEKTGAVESEQASVETSLHEVPSQARDAREAIFAIQAKNEKYKMHIEYLRSFTEVKDDKYKSVIDALANLIERSKHDYDDLKCEMEKKETYWTNALRRSEEERSCMEYEISRLDNLLKTMKKEVEGAKIREASIDKAKGSKKNDMGHDELRQRLSVQVEVLPNLLEQALPTNNHDNQEEEYLNESEYDVLPKWTSFMHVNEELYEHQNLNGNEGKEEELEDFSDGEMEMWESLRVAEEDSYAENEVINGLMKKKKKPLVGKIGSLWLLKNGSSE